MKIINLFIAIAILSICPPNINVAHSKEALFFQKSSWTCNVSVHQACTPEECTKRETKPIIKIDFNRNEYQRCFVGKCDIYEMTTKAWGMYSIIEFNRGGGSYFMVTNDGSEFVESITQGIWTLSSFGQCKSE